MQSTFPWLSKQAIQYESYSFKRLSFSYEPRCSTAQAGTVVLAVDYDPLDATPATKSQILSYYGHSSTGPWDDAVIAVRASAEHYNLKVRPGAAPASSDLKTYDIGNLFLAVSGFSGAVACGELYVDYEVTLMTPQSEVVILGGRIAATAGLDATHLFGSDGALVGLINATRTNTSTLTFLSDWVGTVTFNVTGTGLAGALANTGTSAMEAGPAQVINAGTTNAIYYCQLTALRGQTYIPTITATTVTNMSVVLAPYDVAGL